MEIISIVVPVYNTGAYLECFFSHMQIQSFQDYRAYIVYDKSEDNSLEIIKRYVDEDPIHFEIIYSPKKDGLGAARDIALDSGLLKGDYIMFLDPDDYPDELFLEKMYRKACETNADITVCGFERFDDKTKEILCQEMIHNPTELITDITNFDLLAYMNPVVWDKLYKKSVIANTRFTNIKRTEDVFWLIRLLPKIKSMTFINESLYHYRCREDSLLNTFSEKMYYDVKTNFENLGKEIENSPTVYKNYNDIIEFIIFCRFCIGVTYRASNKRNAKKIEESTLNMMDTYYSSWKSNRFLKYSHCKKHGLKGIAIWSCGCLYKLKLFRIYVLVYSFIKKIRKKEIRW